LAEPELATLPVVWLDTVGVVPLAEPELATLPVVWLFTVPVVPVVLPVLAPTLLLFPAPTLPEAVLPVVLPVLAPVLVSAPAPALPVVAVLPVVLPVLAPVLSLSASASFDLLALVRSSPLPDLPPATSPRESELPSPASLCCALPDAVVEAPALPFALLAPLAVVLLPEDVDDLSLLPALALPLALALPFAVALLFAPADAFPLL